MKLLENIKQNKVFNQAYEANLTERLKLSNICLLIITSIRKSPQDWKVGTHKLINDKVGLAVWVANGRSQMHLEGHNISRDTLNSTELDAIWQAYIWWVEEQKKITEISLSQAIGGIDVELFRKI